MKPIKYIIAIIILLTGCAKRNFFPDEDDAGLSRFTSYGYNIGTVYIILRKGQNREFLI